MRCSPLNPRTAVGAAGAQPRRDLARCWLVVRVMRALMSSAPDVWLTAPLTLLPPLVDAARRLP